MSFTLDLTADCIRNPTRLDQFEIEAAMLWPENSVARQASVQASLAEFGIDRLDELSQEARFRLKGYLKAGAPRVADLQPMVEERIWHGTIAGEIVLRPSVVADFLGAKPLEDLRKEISARLKPDFQIEPKTMANKAGPLHKFRSVAHMWAAHAMFWMQGKPAFPCKVEDVPEFLGTAEAIRVRAEAVRLPNSHHTVMRPNEAVRIPPEVARQLPNISFVRT